MNIEGIINAYAVIVANLNDICRRRANAIDDKHKRAYEVRYEKELSKLRGLMIGLVFAGVTIREHFTDTSFYSPIDRFDVHYTDNDKATTVTHNM